jgi:outer membrane immunogenic protein
MKKIVVAASALVSAATLATTAYAADMAPAGYDWSGFYAGVNAGAAWNNSEVDQNAKLAGERANQLSDKIESNQTVFTGGGLLGYNYQIDQIVLGVEADINYLGFQDDTKRNRDFTIPGHGDMTASGKLSFEGDWFGTLRGRVGYAADNILFYGTGGLAYGHMSADGHLKITDTESGDYVKWDGSSDSTNFGWTIGAGMEYGIDNWSLGLEYLFVDLGSAEWNGSAGGPLADHVDSSVKGSVDYQFSVVRATAKLRF